jgi:hypothetical protein
MRISMKKMELMANLVVRVILAFFLGQENKMVKMEKRIKKIKCSRKKIIHRSMFFIKI